MAITRPDLDAITESDVAELIVSGASEGLHLDFKEVSYGTSDIDKRELLKDVCAFANTNGGHIVIGVRESGGIASELLGIRVNDVDAEVLRIDQIIRSGVEPRIPGCGVRAVALSTGSHAVVIRVSRSWRVPHRVSAQNSNRFWVRNSGGCHEASMEELRSLFGQASTVVDRARQFRNERIALIQQGMGSRPLVGNGRIILHLLPHSSLFSSDGADVEEIYAHHQAFSPISSTGHSPRFNFDGVINERGDELNHGYTQIFRNGAIEATKANIVREHQGRRGVAGLSLEQYFFERYASYIAGLKALGIEPPITVMITLEGIAGAYYHVYNDAFADELVPFDRDVLYLPDCLIGAYGPNESYHVAIRPAFDALWNAVGFSASQFFDDSGLWVGPRRR